MEPDVARYSVCVLFTSAISISSRSISPRFLKDVCECYEILRSDTKYYFIET